MTSRKPNPRLAKVNRTYTVEETAHLYGIHRNTVRQWIKRGLPTVDDRRPRLILGHDLSAYLKNLRRSRKRPCGPGEIYCVRCHEPRRPAGNSAELLPLTPTSGNLVGVCESCGTRIYRRVSLSKLSLIRGPLDITLAKARIHIAECPIPSVNSDFEPEPEELANAQRE